MKTFLLNFSADFNLKPESSLICCEDGKVIKSLIRSVILPFGTTLLEIFA